MKKFFLSFFFIITVSASIHCYEISQSSWDIGTLSSSSGIKKLEIEIYNNSGEKIKIDIISTCSCLYSDKQNIKLSAGKSVSVVFFFDPLEERGKISKYMILRSTQVGFSKALFEVTGFVESESISEIVKNGLDNKSSFKALVEKNNTENTDISDNDVYIKYFYSEGCRSCLRFLNVTVPSLEKSLNRKIYVDRLNILDEEIYKKYISVLFKFGKEYNADIPALLIDEKLFNGEEQITSEFENAVRNYKGLSKIPDTETNTVKEFVIAFMPVVIAGFLDGINPCVFSTLLFLISSLVLAGKKRQEIFFIGIFYSASVFLTYFLIGLGLFHGLRSASVFPVVSEIIKWILIFFLLIIAVLSLYDFFQIRKGRAVDIVLQLPSFLKLQIHSVVRKQARNTSIIAGSVVLGFLVSLFELACTGQIYFPAIAYMLKTGQRSGYFYLIIYNASFILPLMFVFFLIYKGTGSKVITQFFQNHMAGIKISLSLLFFILSGVVFFLN